MNILKPHNWKLYEQRAQPETTGQLTTTEYEETNVISERERESEQERERGPEFDSEGSYIAFDSGRAAIAAQGYLLCIYRQSANPRVILHLYLF